MSSPHVAIVGASLVAARTIRALRRKGHDGPITLVGAETHLPYDRPPLSKQVLTDDEVHLDRLQLGNDELYADVDLRLGVAATALRPGERRVELADGSHVIADHVVVATGATPRRLPGTAGLAGVHVLRTLDDALALRDAFDASERVAVVGAGFIGSEVAASARTRGLHVTVVEALPAPVVRGVGERMGGVLADLHRANDVDLRLGVGVAEVTARDGRATGLRLADGGEVAADAVVVGIGVVPNTDWLDGSGLTIDNGVRTDDRCRATGGDGHVWAGGDVARWPSARYGRDLRVEHWTNATEQANVIAANLLGLDDAPAHDPVPYVWSDQYGTKLQVLGHVSGELAVDVVAGALDAERFLATYSRDGVVEGVVGRDWPRAVMGCRGLVAAGAAVADVRAHVAELS